MNVYIENQLVVDKLDVVAVTGGTFRAYVITTLPILVTDGTLTMTMNTTVGQVMISGIEVIASANIVTHRINCGSTSNTLVRMNDVTWNKDAFFASGAASNRCTTLNITNSIYCSSRFFRTTSGTPFRYNIPVPYNNAIYSLRLYFNEHVRSFVFDGIVILVVVIERLCWNVTGTVHSYPFSFLLSSSGFSYELQYYNAIGARVYDVWTEGTLLLNKLDIFRLAPGKNVPLIMTAPNPILITDGTMTIDFVEVSGEPHINGIEVVYIGPPIVVSPPIAPTTPISIPIKAPTKVPTKAPIKPPTRAPTKAPVVVPVPVPVPPVPVPVPTTTVGNIVHRINCGSTAQVIVPPNNVVWTPDQYATGGLPYNTCGSVTNSIYCTSRYFRTTDVTPHRYQLPVAVSNRMYTVRLHFAEQVGTAIY
jgi:hypothetical protein